MGLLFTDTFPSIVAATKCSECAPALKIVRKRWELWGADHHCIVGLPSTARESCERNLVVNTFLCAKKSDRRRNMFSVCLYPLWLFSLKVATGVIYFHSRYKRLCDKIRQPELCCLQIFGILQLFANSCSDIVDSGVFSGDKKIIDDSLPHFSTVGTSGQSEGQAGKECSVMIDFLTGNRPGVPWTVVTISGSHILIS